MARFPTLKEVLCVRPSRLFPVRLGQHHHFHRHWQQSVDTSEGTPGSGASAQTSLAAGPAKMITVAANAIAKRFILCPLILLTLLPAES